MTRRLFSGTLSFLSSLSSKAIAFTRQTIIRKPQYHEDIVLETSSSHVRQALWINLEHLDAVRFTLGPPGVEPIASGMIAPSYRVQRYDVVDGNLRSYPNNYGILSIKGLLCSVPVVLTLHSNKQFTVFGVQEAFNGPYFTRTKGTMKNFVDTPTKLR